MRESIWIPCKIERGGFSSERSFEIELPGRDKLAGLSNVMYLKDENHQGLDEDDSLGYGESIDGYVTCRIIRKVDAETLLVEFPGTEVVRVQEDALREMA